MTLKNVNWCDEYGKTPLHIACSLGITEEVLSLISRGAAINARDYDGYTPLSCAVFSQKREALLALISQGADLNVQDKCEKSALYWGIRMDKAEVSLILISYGAEMPDMDVRNSYQRITMHQAAARCGLTDRVISLLRDHPSTLKNDDPESLLNLANVNKKADTAAAIKSFIASRSIKEILEKSRLHL